MRLLSYEGKVNLLFYLFGTINAFLLVSIVPTLFNVGLQFFTYGVGFIISDKVR